MEPASQPSAVSGFANVDDALLETMVASLPPAMLVPMAREAARLQDLRVLGALSKAGLFGYDPASIEAHRYPPLFAACELPFVAAWANVLGGAEVAKTDTLPGFARPRELQVGQPFRQAFRDMLLGFREAVMAAGQEGLEEPQPVRDTLLALCAAACAMNDTRAVRMALSTLREVYHITNERLVMDTAQLFPSILGRSRDAVLQVALTPETKAEKPFLVAPWALCFEFDVPEALQVVRELRAMDPFHDCAEILMSLRDGHRREVSAVELVQQGRLGSTPENWRRMLPENEDATSWCRDAAAHLLSSAVSKGGVWLDAAVEGRLHKLNLHAFVTSAITRGRLPALERIREDFPWTPPKGHDPDDHVLFHTGQRARLKSAREAGVLTTLLCWGVEDGHREHLLNLDRSHRVDGHVRRQSLVEYLGSFGHVDAVMFLLNQGFDPTRPNAHGQTLPQYLEAQVHQMTEGKDNKLVEKDRIDNVRSLIDLIRVWNSGLEARRVLDDMHQPEAWLGGMP